MDSEAGYSRMDILGRLRGRGRQRFSLKMTPMIDMIFLLLIFFVVAAKWRPQENFLPVQLAAGGVAGVPQAGKPESLVISIERTRQGCRVDIGRQMNVEISSDIEAGLANVAAAIKKVMNQQSIDTGDPVEIVCAAEVQWEYLAKLYNSFYGMGLTDITFRMTEEK